MSQFTRRVTLGLWPSISSINATEKNQNRTLPNGHSVLEVQKNSYDQKYM